MQLSRKALNARWGWTSVAAVVSLMVLSAFDSILRARTGYGTADLQGVPTGWGIRTIMDHWTSPPDSALAGFGLGFDYLFMPLYAAALFYGAIAACERFAPKPGVRRRIMTLMAMAPVGGALFDAGENALQMYMLVRGPSDMLAFLAKEATAAKFAGVTVGLVLSLMAAMALLSERRKFRKTGGV